MIETSCCSSHESTFGDLPCLLRVLIEAGLAVHWHAVDGGRVGLFVRSNLALVPFVLILHARFVYPLLHAASRMPL